MDDIKMPAFEELFEPTLEAFKRLGGSATNQELHDGVVEILGLSDAQVDKLHQPGKSNVTSLKYDLGWVRSFMRHEQLVDNTARAVWSLTEKGRNAKTIDGKAIKRRVHQKIRSAKKAAPVPDERDPQDPVDEPLPEGQDEINEDWRASLYDALLNMHPDAFERLCQRLLRESGFTQVDVTGRSNDGGIDGIGVMRIGGFLSFRVLFQCKRYKGSVGAGTVRDFRGAMIGRTDKGLILTTGSFTSAAQREATRDGAPEIDLVDGELLIDKLKELRLGVSVELVEQVTVDAAWFTHI